MKTYVCLVMMVLLVVTGCSLPNISLIPEAGPLEEVTLEGTGDEKVLVISINGTISDQPKARLLSSQPSMVQELVAQLKRAEKDNNIKAVLLKVNSPGGTVTASDIIYHELSAYKERTGVKLVVSMMNVVASGGYYISLPADWIMAHPTTLTGSVGVVFVRTGFSALMEKAGLRVDVSKSGKFKDMGSPFKPPSEEDNLIFQKLTDEMAARFLGLVAKHRSVQPDHQDLIATAQIFSAAKAREIGLVDQIGYLSDALAKAKNLAGLNKGARVVTYRRTRSEDDNIYNPAIQQQKSDIIVNGSPLSLFTTAHEAGFYYLWPAALGH